MRRFAQLANIPAIGTPNPNQRLNEKEEIDEALGDDPDLDDPEDDVLRDMGAPDELEDLEPSPEDLEPSPEDLEPSPEAEGGVVKGEVAVMDLVDAIAAAITDTTGVPVRAEDGGEEAPEDVETAEAPPFSDVAPPLDMAPEEEEEEERMAENYIRQRVRQALTAESNSGKAQPSKIDHRVAEVYNKRMKQIATQVYQKAHHDVISEAKTQAFSSEVQRRVLSRILEDTKK